MAFDVATAFSEADEEELVPECDTRNRKILVDLALNIINVVLDAHRRGFRVVFLSVPRYTKSFYSLLARAFECYNTGTRPSRHAYVKTRDGRTLIVKTQPYIMFQSYQKTDMPVFHIFYGLDKDMAKKEDKQDLGGTIPVEDALLMASEERTSFLVVGKSDLGMPEETYYYSHRRVYGLTRKILSQHGLETRNYVGRAPFTLLFLEPEKAVLFANSEESRRPPAHSITIVKNGVSGINSLVLDGLVEKRVRDTLELVRLNPGRATILIVSLPNNGRSTLAYAIAKELGGEAYNLSMTSVLSKWQGESEANLKRFFEEMKGREGSVAVITDMDFVFNTKDGGPSSASTLKSILTRAVADPERDYPIVFISDTNIPRELLSSTTLAKSKLFLPLPGPEERKRLIEKYFDLIATPEEKRLLKEAAEDKYKNVDDPYKHAYEVYIGNITAWTVGFGSGELYNFLYETWKIYLLKHLKNGGLPSIEEYREYLRTHTAKDYIRISAKIANMRRTAADMGDIESAEALYQAEQETSKKWRQIRRTIEKYFEI